MKRLFSPIAALALLLAASAGAKADPIQWTYNWTPGSPAVTADGNPGAGVTFTNEPSNGATGNSDIVATNLRVFSAAPASVPDVLNSQGAYSLVLTLSTVENSQTLSGSLTFAGKLGGSFSKESANVSNVFGPNATQTLTLGSSTFTVSLASFTGPAPPRLDPLAPPVNAGSIGAHVNVSAAVTPTNVPEPSTMLLSALGLSFLGGAAWRKRKLVRKSA